MAAKKFTEITRREILSMMRLSDQQRLFCERYVAHFDGVLAAKEAGYKLFEAKYPDKPAQQALALKEVDGILESKSVQAYIMLLKQSTSERLKISMDSLIDEYRAMAFARMSDFVTWDKDGLVFIKDSEELTELQRRGVMEVSQQVTAQGTTTKIKLFPKQAALDKLYAILRELEEEEAEREKVGGLRVSAKQVRQIMQDPAKRRAIEHLAEGLFNVKVRVADKNLDRNRARFNKLLEDITEKFQATTLGGLKEIGYGNEPQGEGNVYDLDAGEEDAPEG